jgi:Fe2+ or Zn2+ uptake regulation protein
MLLSPDGVEACAMSRTVTDELAAHAARLRVLGLRCTKSRLYVLAVLAEDGGHLSARAIRRRVLAAGGAGVVSTVYRTVERLTELGLLHRVPNREEAVYGLVGRPHHHAVCEECGAVADVPVTLTVEGVRDAEASSGFALTEVLLVGLCGACGTRDAPYQVVAEPAARQVAGWKTISEEGRSTAVGPTPPPPC